MNTNYYAAHNFSAPAQNVDQLRAGLTGGSFGKGSTAEQGEASALMEAIERYSGIFQSDEIRRMRRFTDFAPGEAIRPNDILLFSEAQSQSSSNEMTEHEAHQTQTAPPFDQSARIEWSPVWSLRDNGFKYVPTSLLYFFYSGPAAFQTNPMAAPPATRLRKRSFRDFLNWWNGIHTPSGGTTA